LLNPELTPKAAGMTAPPMPQKPQVEERREGRSSGWVALAFAGVVVMLAIISLAIFTLGAVGPLVIVAFLILGGGVLHYIVWGWWLGAYLRDKYNIEEDEL